MPMHYLLEYSDNYSMALGSFLNYYRDEIDDVDDKASQGKSLECKSKITVKTQRISPRSPQPLG